MSKYKFVTFSCNRQPCVTFAGRKPTLTGATPTGALDIEHSQTHIQVTHRSQGQEVWNAGSISSLLKKESARFFFCDLLLSIPIAGHAAQLIFKFLLNNLKLILTHSSSSQALRPCPSSKHSERCQQQLLQGPFVYTEVARTSFISSWLILTDQR